MKYIFWVILGVSLLLQSCHDNKFDIDVSDSQVSIDWLRLETDFTGLATKPSFKKYNDSLQAVYGTFYQLYALRVMRFGDPNAAEYEQNVMRFLTHRDIHQLHRTVDSVYHDLVDYQDEISQAFSYYHHYFPNKPLPVVVSMITAMSNNIVVTDSVLGVGLDMYLGDSNKVYSLAGIPEYMRKKSQPNYMVCDMMRGWVLSEFEPKDKRDEVLAQIINYGKGMYIMDALFPFATDAQKIGFTPKEIDWCQENEATIWAKLIEEKQLYATDMRVLRGLTGPGPFTPGFPKESPGQLGFWVGWQIVRSFMEAHPETTLEKLTEIEDPQWILRNSKYKPR